MRTRFAPTPSGYLHTGNVVHLAVVRNVASELGASIALRIDDIDTPRLRREYLDDIFEVMQWMEVGWDQGPRTTDDVLNRGGMGVTPAHMCAVLNRARAAGLDTYACNCSRRELAAHTGQPCGCSVASVDWEPGVTALRMRIPRGTVVSIDGVSIDVSHELGDVVLWRRDDLPSYQLASVIADAQLGTDLLIRGVDLRTSTALQVHLAPALGAPELATARTLHHRLIVDTQGRKLSKSAGAQGRPLERTPELRSRIEDIAADVTAEILG